MSAEASAAEAEAEAEASEVLDLNADVAAVDNQEQAEGTAAYKKNRDAPKLAVLLREMKNGLDIVRGKVEALTSKVKENQYPTTDGISLPRVETPVAPTLLSMHRVLSPTKVQRLSYRGASRGTKPRGDQAVSGEVPNELGPRDEVRKDLQNADDPLKYKPNPDMLVSKVDRATENGTGVYRPPHFAPTSMDEDKISRKERQTTRKEKEALLRAKQSTFAKELMDEIEGRPEEMRETVGAESRELTRYKAKLEKRARQEEELFTRAPITKLDKKMEKHLRKSRNGLMGLSDFYDDVRALHMGKNDASERSYVNPRHGGKRFKKHKVKG